MNNSKIVSIQQYKTNKNYYTIGLVIGALRAELENGDISIESALDLLTDRTKSLIVGEMAGGAR